MPLIDQQKAIDKFTPWLNVKGYSEGELNMLRAVINELENMQPAPQMTLTEDDLETIRIHMSAHKEDLCNQGRWKEAREYEDLLAKLPSTTLFVSPWPIRCRDCDWWTKQPDSLQGPPGGARKLMEEAEAVNAVSEEWIDSYIDWLNGIGTEFASRDARAINAMMIKWEKEQKQPTCGPDYCEIGGHDEQT